ncbi:MAG: AAA family ATPase [Nitrosospira sp.]|nr:AAA family ATPase [Nitrosospira sp.]
MPKPIIHQLALKNLGVFRDCATSLRKYNLIYGFNGSGKTTLSRIFSSLETGTLQADLPEGGTFDVELSDGVTLRSVGDYSALKGRLLVLNVDFVEKNFMWKEGKARPVFYLGREQVEFAEHLKKISGQKNEHETTHALAKTNKNNKSKVFTTYKRDTARNISEQLILGRKYEAPNLVSDYFTYEYDEAHCLSEDQTQLEREKMMRKEPLAEIKPLTSVAINSLNLINKVESILGTTIGEIIIEDLRDHDSMLNWIREGVIYHKDQDLLSCLFCGNNLTKDRLENLQNLINGKFNKFIGEIATLKAEAKKLQGTFETIGDGIPSLNDLSRSLHGEFEVAAKILKASLSAQSGITQVILELLSKKESTPNSLIDSNIHDEDIRIAIRDEDIIRRITDLNNIITRHNVEYINFENTKKAAATKLKNHYLSINHTTYLSYKQEEESAETELDKIFAELESLTKEELRLRNEVRKHGPAATRTSKMIHNYLGREELEVTALEEGYQLCRNGKPIKGPLSEGEKTAIALCYFLSALEAEGRKLKDLIVVVDDPISSLDTKALNYSFSILKSALGGVAQLLILTHNLHFMNETKKWLKRYINKKDDSKSEAALLFLDAVKNRNEKHISSIITKLPPYIREYESEYQYLFHLILQFTQAQGMTEYFYLMPNAMRKVLEIFLTFKLPGTMGLSDKVAKIAELNGLEKGSFLALDRLVQLESHADNLDDLITFSSITIEETKDAADVLLQMMKASDSEHYRLLEEICRVEPPMSSSQSQPVSVNPPTGIPTA